ncbi:MAG: N-acetylmuramoyl-L-alanine amidase [Puniceicoccales bacterium]|nr:N-acetylmuramoyl-L-alanine amidase [Puniceicoccales bacterium]
MPAAPLGAQSATGIVNLHDTFRHWGYALERPGGRASELARWKNQWSSVSIERNKACIALNGARVWLGFAVSEGNGNAYLRRHDYEHTLLPIMAPRANPASPAPSARPVRHVLLDPGHGGKDPGNTASRFGLMEKTMTLDVALRLKAILEQRGLKVSLTRTTDVYVELVDRAALARKINADLFVSIHFNSTADTSSVSGVESYVLTPQGQHSTNDSRRRATASELRAREPGHKNGPWNILLGYHVHAAMLAKLRAEDRGLRRARFQVLQTATCPAVLVECGFLNNPAEAALVRTGAYREKIAQGIADGIARYQQILNKLVAGR